MVARLFFFFYLFLCSCCQTRASQTRAGESAHCATLRRERGARVARRAARLRRELGQQASPLAPGLAAGVRTLYLEYRAGYIFRISPEGFTRAGGQMGQHTAAAHAEARSPSAAGPGTHVHACGTTHRRCSAAPLSTEHSRKLIFSFFIIFLSYFV